MPEPSRNPSPWRQFGTGMELAGVILVLAWLGYWFDQWANCSPWGMLAGAMLGLIGGLYNLFRDINKDSR
ncbi:MAG: AtpZ/AtpI family protein [Phycisphaeraceae bacterium]